MLIEISKKKKKMCQETVVYKFSKTHKNIKTQPEILLSVKQF